MSICIYILARGKNLTIQSLATGLSLTQYSLEEEHQHDSKGPLEKDKIDQKRKESTRGQLMDVWTS